MSQYWESLAARTDGQHVSVVTRFDAPMIT